MPLTPAAEQELRDILREYHAAHAGVVAPTGEGKALEAWVLLQMAHTVFKSMSASWSVSLRRGDGSPLPQGASFDLPSQHSRIQPSSPTAPCYVLLEHHQNPKLRFELRGSVQWMGRSGARHEIDVSVVPAKIGEAITGNGGGYPHGLPIAAIECKDKGGIGPLDETRQKLARMYDLTFVTQPAPPHGACRIFATQTNHEWGKWSSRYVAFFAKGIFGIVRAGTFQSGAKKLAAHYHIEHYASVYTNSNAISDLQLRFQRVLKESDGY
jgi:hypothetical protein